MNKFEFMCNFWSYNKAISGKIDNDLVEKMMDDWKHSMKSFKVWKKELIKNSKNKVE